MAEYLNDHRVLIALLLQLVGSAFVAGCLFQQFKSLKTTVLNGLTDRLIALEKIVERLSECLAVMEERYRSRGEWIKGIEQDVKALEKGGG